MKYIARRFRMKSGEYCVLRSPEGRDAAQRIAFLRQVNAETPFMARGAGDTPADELLTAELLEDQLEDEAALEIAAFFNGEMIACASAAPTARAYPRKRHRAGIGICVRRAFWDQGLGGALIGALIAEAGGMGYRLLELTVVSENLRARRLYEKYGFEMIGCMPDALQYEDGVFCDEVWMVRRI